MPCPTADVPSGLRRTSRALVMSSRGSLNAPESLSPTSLRLLVPAETLSGRPQIRDLTDLWSHVLPL